MSLELNANKLLLSSPAYLQTISTNVEQPEHWANGGVHKMTVLQLEALVSNPKYLGDEASDGLFGANFLFNRDGTSKPGGIDPNYQRFVDGANVGNLRYPGGTLTETQLDLRNPNSTNQNYMNVKDGLKETTVPISNFLNYVAAAGMSATIVIPTYRFLTEESDETGHRTVNNTNDDDLRSFIDFAMYEARRAGAEISAFEIGNEWYTDNSSIFGFRMSPIEYGRVAAHIAKIVQEMLTNFTSEYNSKEPAVVIQLGPAGAAEIYNADGFKPETGNSGSITATELIFNQFTDPESRSAVDGVVTHRFLTGTDAAVTGWAYSPFSTWNRLALSTLGFNEVDQYVTEWNLAARNGAEGGLSHFDTMVELVREMMLAGVDYANVWSIQQNNSTSMIDNVGFGNQLFGGLTTGGLAFDMLSSQVRGLRAISTPEYLSGLAVNAFGSEKRTVIFLTQRGDADRLDSLDLLSLASAGHHVSVYKVSMSLDGKPEIQIQTVDLTSNQVSIDLRLAYGETIMVVVAKDDFGTLVEGYYGADSLLGSAFDDTIIGGENNDTLSGSDGEDVILGDEGADAVFGGMGDDIIDGGGGSDALFGGSGDDILVYGPGWDSLFGGEGEDVLSLAFETTKLTINLRQEGSLQMLLAAYGAQDVEGIGGGRGNDLFLGGDSRDVLLGGAGHDLMFGSFGDDKIGGDEGNDYLYGDEGDDLVFGGIGDDFLQGGEGSDEVFGGSENDIVFGDVGNDLLNGGAGMDTLDGGEGDDRFIISAIAEHGVEEVIRGGGGMDELRYTGTLATSLVLGTGVDVERVVIGTGTAAVAGLTGTGAINVDGSALAQSVTLIGNAGANRLTGGAGNDTLVGGLGNDAVAGGAGVDTASYASATAGVTVNLGLATAQVTGGAGTDVLSGIENLIGSGLNDVLTGSTGANQMEGGAGNDVLNGGAGMDTLDGGEGDDRFIISAIAEHGVEEVIRGGGGMDELRYTGTFAASLVLGAGVDVERVVIGTGTAAVAGLTGTGAINVDGSALAQSVTLIGNAGANRLTGGTGNDSLDGGAGNDTLSGGAGEDTLTGGLGNDLLIGGASADEFVFTNRVSGVTVIADFNNLNGGSNEGDILRFEGLEIGTFEYLGTRSFTGGSDNSEARVSGSLVLVDTNGDGTADITITLSGLINASQLTADDFLFG